MRGSSDRFQIMTMRKFTEDCLINASRARLSGSWNTQILKRGSQRRASLICGAQARVRLLPTCHIYADWFFSWLGKNNDCVSSPRSVIISDD